MRYEVYNKDTKEAILVSDNPIEGNVYIRKNAHVKDVRLQGTFGLRAIQCKLAKDISIIGGTGPFYFMKDKPQVFNSVNSAEGFIDYTASGGSYDVYLRIHLWDGSFEVVPISTGMEMNHMALSTTLAINNIIWTINENGDLW